MSWRPRRWRHWTLRSRLVLVVAALAALGLVVADTAGFLLIRTYLSDRIDDQLAAMARPFAAQPPGADAPPPRRRFGPAPLVYVYTPAGVLDPARSSAVEAARPAPESFADTTARARQARPFTVPAADGSADWRLLAVPVGATGGVAVLAPRWPRSGRPPTGCC